MYCVPRTEKNGGILAQIPILVGDRDINAGIFQVRRSNDPYVKDNPDFMPIEELAFFDQLPQESKDYLKGAMVTIKPVEYTQENALAQSFGDGQSNTLPESIMNGMQQTGADTLNVRYNPSRGGIADSAESFVDKSTPITTGMAKEYGENRRLITQTNQAAGIRSNFADHSQANVLDHKGAKYIGGGDINLLGTGDARQREDAGITATSNAYGSPVPWEEMEKITVDAGLVFSGSHVNEGDGVATTLAGNKDGKNETATTSERVKGVKDLIHNIYGSKYGDNPSGHSTYECKANCGNNADLTPEQLAAQRRGQ